MYYVHNRYDVKEQYVVYDSADLFADVGGYLGLLLGYSLLSIYDNAKMAWGRHRQTLRGGISRKQ